jgi:hypothetical protein
MLTLERKVESGAESTLALAESGYVDLPGPVKMFENLKPLINSYKIRHRFIAFSQVAKV